MRRPAATRKAISALALGLFLAGAVSGCGTPAAPQIVGQMTAAFEKLTDYQATLDLKYTLAGQDQTVEIKQSFKKPDRHRLEFLAPAELKGQLTVFNGQTMWTYSPSDNEVLVFTQAGEEVVGQDQRSLISGVLDSLKSAESVRAAGRGRIEGRFAYILEVTPATPKGDDLVSLLKVWVDRATWLPLKVETYNGAGKLVSSALYKDVKENSGLADDLFKFTPPQGANVTQGGALPAVVSIEQARSAANFGLKQPTYLPAGLSLLQISRIGSGADVAIVFEYGRGEAATLSISENKAIPGATDMPGMKPTDLGGLSAEVIQTDEFSSVHWVVGGVEISMTSNLPLDELGKVARSIR
ncbi:MAG: outer membrane lipoprotein-sorting protein [Bacillota bacterium]